MTATSIAANHEQAAERRAQFERDGYVISRGLFSGDEMRDFIAECHALESLNWDRPEPNSKGSMRFYSEIFRRSERVRRFISQQALVDHLVPIAGPDLWMRWDQAVAKGPDSGVFPWHTDEGYDRLPQPHFEVWIALSEMRPDNGGLWVMPGSHRQRHRHRRVEDHVIALDSDRLDAADSGRVFLHAEAGDVVVFSSKLLHKTYENTTACARWAYVAEVLKLGDYDPTSKPPFFVLARDGHSVGEFTAQLACASDPVQIVRTLPLALRHRYAGPLARRLRAALKPASPA